jgi:hypothetical protein
VLAKNLAFYQAKYIYDADWLLVEVIEHTTAASADVL